MTVSAKRTSGDTMATQLILPFQLRVAFCGVGDCLAVGVRAWGRRGEERGSIVAEEGCVARRQDSGRWRQNSFKGVGNRGRMD